MKTTIKINNTDGKKLAVACTVNGVTITGRKKIGTDLSLVDLSYKAPADLFEAGRLMSSVTGSELDVVEETPTEDKTAVKTKK